MPITRKQFEWGIGEETEKWMRKIHSFLAEHKDEAFSAEELYQGFTGKNSEFHLRRMNLGLVIMRRKESILMLPLKGLRKWGQQKRETFGVRTTTAIVNP